MITSGDIVVDLWNKSPTFNNCTFPFFQIRTKCPFVFAMKLQACIGMVIQCYCKKHNHMGKITPKKATNNYIYSKTTSAILSGIDIVPIEVEVTGTSGIPNFSIIGLPSKTVAESKDRITSSLHSCGIRIKSKKTIVNLAPANIKKPDSGLEFAILVGVLKMYQHIPNIYQKKALFLGELSLNGTIKPIKGILPLVIGAKKLHFTNIFIPFNNSDELKIVSDIKIHPIKSINHYIKYAKKDKFPTIKNKTFIAKKKITSTIFYDQVSGQYQAKRALEIAIAGGHHLLMIGPPGIGKSMLAHQAIHLLPQLSENESIQVTSLHSIRGINNGSLVTQRPIRSPHHTISLAGLIGGGTIPAPGEVSLAHTGVLFLDELPEFSPHTLEALRQPLEEGEVRISRIKTTITFPARFTLIAAANPCPCGYYGTQDKTCTCSSRMIDRYKKRLSGPLLDRIDIQVRLENKINHIINTHSHQKYDTLQQIQQKIITAKQRQSLRYGNSSMLNGYLSGKNTMKYCVLSNQAKKIAQTISKTKFLSVRGYFKIIKIAQTIADLDKSSQIGENHINEALQYRF